ncbi:hypothetical protein J6590_039143 [Homalodisca vitripennis]|nr:hypothetical protein J6590_039143 [Homalodisca vitripennis]
MEPVRVPARAWARAEGMCTNIWDHIKPDSIWSHRRAQIARLVVLNDLYDDRQRCYELIGFLVPKWALNYYARNRRYNRALNRDKIQMAPINSVCRCGNGYCEFNTERYWIHRYQVMHNTTLRGPAVAVETDTMMHNTTLRGPAVAVETDTVNSIKRYWIHRYQMMHNTTLGSSCRCGNGNRAVNIDEDYNNIAIFCVEITGHEFRHEFCE